MSDLIERQAVIDAMNSEGYTKNMRVHRKILQIPAAPRWVRCEDEMPTKAGRYLVMDKDGDFNVDEWHNTFGWRFITQFDAERITHWMPIEPPKEDA